MRERKPRQVEERNPVTTLRRSPRFLHQRRTGVDNLSVPPDPDSSKIHGPELFGTPITKPWRKGDGNSENGEGKGTKSKCLGRSGEVRRRLTGLGSGVKVISPDLWKEYAIEKRVTRSSARGTKSINGQENRSNVGIGISAKSGEGCRRSGRLNARAKVGNTEDVQDLSWPDGMEKRVTRSSFRFDNSAKNQADGFDHKRGNVSIEKRVTRSSNRRKMTLVKKTCNDSTDRHHEMVRLNETNPKGNDGMSNSCALKRDVEGCLIERESDDKNCERMGADVEGNRNQAEGDCGIVQSWTEEQESALQRAYFTAKPTPHFWKKVARMVPGKSAKECFDRIQSDHVTPSHSRTRSRANRNIASPLLFSASKLLGPTEAKTKWVRPSRRTLLAQKTVRQILQKQCNEDQNYRADFFAVLEPKVDLPCLNFQLGTPFASPELKQGLNVLERCRETSSSANRKHLSGMNNSQKVPFVSPPVLKQIRNKALHEKYIDQLHCRDFKRKSEASRNAKCIQDKSGSPSKVKSIKVAKDALVSDAQDVIIQFRSLQPINDNLDNDDDEDPGHGGDDEDEEELC